MEYISPSAGYELTTLVVIVTDFIGTGSDPETLLTRGGAQLWSKNGERSAIGTKRY